ncbi:unnamed protein product [Caenorhabditis auriculariae]|uniref:Integrase catalytic domain-containing protein n=1 Tax=Caenorhabditis auriculariae TaxID=2777116 RepID=A0A8S1GQI7_9PELO|nr:unnamed protein product [Caenorhabditis auriculariae]
MRIRKFCCENQHDDNSWLKIAKVCLDKECVKCLLFNDAPQLTAPLNPYITSEPLEIVALDLIDMGRAASGNRYILTIIDHFTKFAAAHPIQNKIGETVATTLTENWLLRKGRIPETILTDQGNEFKNDLMETVTKMMGSKHVQTKSYNSRENGCVGRFKRTLESILKKKMAITTDWDKLVPAAVFAYNSTKHGTTGESPYFLMYGRDPRIPSEIEDKFKPKWVQNYLDSYKYTLMEVLYQAHDKARANLLKEGAAMKRQFDKKNKKEKTFPKVGDRVLLCVPTEAANSKHPKLVSGWSGPFREKETSGTSALITPILWKEDPMMLARVAAKPELILTMEELLAVQARLTCLLTVREILLLFDTRTSGAEPQQKKEKKRLGGSGIPAKRLDRSLGAEKEVLIVLPINVRWTQENAETLAKSCENIHAGTNYIVVPFHAEAAAIGCSVATMEKWANAKSTAVVFQKRILYTLKESAADLDEGGGDDFLVLAGLQNETGRTARRRSRTRKHRTAGGENRPGAGLSKAGGMFTKRESSRGEVLDPASVASSCLSVEAAPTTAENRVVALARRFNFPLL